MKILRPGLALLQYIGTGETLFRSKVENRKYITLEPSDYVLVDTVTAVYLKRGTQFKEVKTEVDLSTFLLKKESLEQVGDDVLIAEMIERELFDAKVNLSTVSDEDLENELIARGLVADDNNTVSDLDAEGAEKEEALVLTKENVMSADIKEIKRVCKEHNITLGKKNKETLISLLLPFLD